MKLAFLLLVLFLVNQPSLLACGGLTQQVYAGEINYKLNPNNPLICTINVSLDFDVSDNVGSDSVWINWGDGTGGSIFAYQIELDSQANKQMGFNNYYRHEYSGTHIYSSLPPYGFYVVSLLQQYRLNNISNINTGDGNGVPYYLEAQIAIDTIQEFNNQSPIWNLANIGFGTLDTGFSENFLAYDPQNDSIVFDLVTPLEGHGTPVPIFELPEAFCADLGESTIFSINHQTGEIVWTNPCAQGIFTLVVQLRKYRNGRLMGTVMRDESIYISNDHVSSISTIPYKTIAVFPNPATSFINLRNNEPGPVSVLDLFGRTVLKQTVQPNSVLDISVLDNGVYFICGNNSFTATKFFKE